MATKVFGYGLMQSKDIDALNKTIKFGTGSDASFTAALVDDGAFVTLGDLAADSVYAGEKDWNTYHAFAPSAATLTAEDIYVVDIDDVAQGVIGGNVYKMGSKLVDLKVAAGGNCHARALKKGDKFWLGAGNFVSAPTVGKYANLTANDTRLTPANSITANQLNIVIRASKPMTIGTLVDYSNSSFEQEYLVEVL